MESDQYELGNVGEDFGLQPIGDDEDDSLLDDETFGDTGPLNDDWEQSHEALAQTHEQFSHHHNDQHHDHPPQHHQLPHHHQQRQNQDGFFSFQSLERGSDVRHQRDEQRASHPRTSTTTTTSARSPGPGLLDSQGGLDEDGYGPGAVDDDQLEDMLFRGVLNDESDKDQYFNNRFYPNNRNPNQPLPPHFAGSPIDRPGLGPLADSPAHSSIWGRSPSASSLWGGAASPSIARATAAPTSEPIAAAHHPRAAATQAPHATSPPPGFKLLQKPPINDPSIVNYSPSRPPNIYQTEPYPPQGANPQLQAGKMLSVEELEARLMRQSQQPPSSSPPPAHNPLLQLQQQLMQMQLQQMHKPNQAQAMQHLIQQQQMHMQHVQQQQQHQLQQQQQQLQQQQHPQQYPPLSQPQPMPPQPQSPYKEQHEHHHKQHPSTTQVYVPKNSVNNVHHQQFKNINNNNFSNNQQKQPRGITLGDILQPLKTGRGGHNNTHSTQRGQRFERKLMMSQEEIEAIIHMQHAQLHSNHPYTDDYYYYQLQKRRGSQPLTRDEPPDIIRHHKPLCESTPTRTFPPKKIINDPLAGSLGRIPSHNVRAPRTLLQLIASEMEEKEDGTTTNSDDRIELGVHQSLMLAVENAFNHLLDIEDIDLILSSSNGSVNVTHLLQKRDDLSMDLFKSLNFDAYPLSKAVPPVPIPTPPFSLNTSSSIPTSASINARIIPPVVQEDEFFVGLALIPKGKKLLARAIPLFPPSIAVPVLLAFMRNFLFLLVHNEREKEKDKGSKMFIHLNFLIGGLGTPHILLAFHTLLLFHGEMAILKLLQYQESVDVILNFMRRGHELTVAGGGPNAAHTPPAAHWRGMFTELLNRVSFGRTLPPLLSRPFMWDLMLAMAVDSDDMQRSVLADAIREDVISLPHLEQNPAAAALRATLNL